MKYIDIKDKVADTTNNLSAIPGAVVWEMLTEEWAQYLPSNGAPIALPDIKHERVKCITHITFDHVDQWDWLSDYRVCTVLVDGKPAFFFVSRVEDDQHNVKTYVLDAALVKVFLHLIVQLALETSTTDSMYCAELVSEDEEIYTYKPIEDRLAQ